MPVQEFLCCDNIYKEYLCKLAHIRSLPKTISLSNDYLDRNHTQNYIQKENKASSNPSFYSTTILWVKISKRSQKNLLFL